MLSDPTDRRDRGNPGRLPERRGGKWEDFSESNWEGGVLDQTRIKLPKLGYGGS